MTPATVANMRKYREVPGVLAYSPTTGEEYSANPGDYWDHELDSPLTDSNGAAMILVTRRVVYQDVTS